MEGEILGTQDSISAELLAIYKACSLCVTNQVLQGKTFELVSDSLVVVTWYISDSFGSFELVHLVYNTRELVRKHGNMVVRFCSRASNSFADNLAKKASNMEGDVIQWSL